VTDRGDLQRADASGGEPALSACAALFHEVLLMDAGGISHRIQLSRLTHGSGRVTLEGSGDGFSARLELTRDPGDRNAFAGALVVTRASTAPAVDRGIRVPVVLGGDAPPSWLIPGCFYGENRTSRCTRRYPRFAARGDIGDGLTSDWWSFPSDRATTPVVFGWVDPSGVALGIDPPAPGDEVRTLAGLGFAGPSARGDGIPSPGRASLWIDLPARSEPVAYDGFEEAAMPSARTLRWEPGASIDLPLRVTVLEDDRHGYASVLRAAEQRTVDTHPTRPWLDAGETADLAAHGLLAWHFRADQRILVEVATFDRDLLGRPLVGEDRPNMHVAWLSGTPAAGALLAHGRRSGHEASVEAGVAVLDHVSSGVSPSGLFWGEWRADRGWSGGWNPDPGWVHVRTAGEATLFLVRALVAERSQGVDHPGWERAIRSNLEAIVRLQDAHGSYGTYVDATTSIVREWDGTGGLIWIPALLEAADALGGATADDWRRSAAMAGETYAGHVEREWLYGAPEDIHLAPSSEDGYDAILAYVSLLEHADAGADATAIDRWRSLALRAAEWTLTFRFTYDSVFPEQTMLGTYGFATRGADVASPANQHLHAYGLICVPELLRLADRLDDGYLRRSALDHVRCFRQFIARVDGDFGARRGMTTERFYHTDAFGPKGALLPLSHAWCLGLILQAALDELRREVAQAPAAGDRA
jgi:hypothetical protein